MRAKTTSVLQHVGTVKQMKALDKPAGTGIQVHKVQPAKGPRSRILHSHCIHLQVRGTSSVNRHMRASALS